MIDKNEESSARRSLEIIHEGINFDFCRKVTLCEAESGLCKLKMEAFIQPKKKKHEY